MRFCLLFSIAAIPLTLSGVAAEELTVAEIIARHRASVESLQDLRADFISKMTWVGRPTETSTGSYLKSKDVIRLRTGTVGIAMQDVRIENNEARTVNQSWKKPESILYETSIHRGDRFVTTGELQVAFLFHGFPGPAKKMLTLQELYTLPDTDILVRSDSLEGTPCIRVQLTYRTDREIPVTIHHWHDLQTGCLIVKRILQLNTLHFEIRVSDFQTQNGSRFPTSQQSRSSTDGQLEYEQTIDLKNLAINQPIAPHELELPAFPNGASCRDYTSLQIYPIDTNWKAVGPPTAQIVEPSASAINDRSQNLGNRLLEVDPKSTSFWILVICITLTVFVVFGLFVARRRQSKRSS